MSLYILPTSIRDFMKEFATKALENIINQYLSLDPKSQKRFQQLEGKTLKLVIKPLTLYFIFDQHKINVSDSQVDAKIDATIEGAPLAFIQLHFSSKEQIPTLFKQQLTISGDIDFGQEVRDLFSELDIDWEEYLSKFTGDIIAHQMTNLMEGSINFIHQTSSALQQSLTEYLQEETDSLPCREEVEDFCDEVDSLKLRVDRLYAKWQLKTTPKQGNIDE